MTVPEVPTQRDRLRLLRWLILSRKGWREMEPPQRLEVVGVYVGIVGLFLAVLFWVYPFEGSKPAAAAARAGGTHVAKLLVPSSLTDARVLVDGHEATVVNRTSNVIAVEIPSAPGNRKIVVEGPRHARCTLEIAVTQDVVLNPCGA